MDRIVFLPTIVLGAVLIIVYLVRCYRVERKAELPTIINILLSASGIVGAGVLLASCFFEEVLKKLSDIKIYIFIAGIAVLYVSIHSLRNVFPVTRAKKMKSAQDDYVVDTKIENPSA